MTELEQRLLAENEQLKLEIAELKKIVSRLKQITDPAPRVEYVDEKTRRFRGELYKKQKSTGYYVQARCLHVDVYKFYHNISEIPKNCLIHHDGKDENGNYDKEKNDIEYWLEMFTCSVCGKVFRARKAGSNRYCSKKCRLEGTREIMHSDRYKETRICQQCGKEFEVLKYRDTKYCSSRCGALAQWERQKS